MSNETRTGQTNQIGDLVRILRSRWISILALTLLGIVSAVVLTLMTTPMYQATTRLFVSTTVGASASDLYQGNRLSQERVLSYTELLEGMTLAQRTIDKLNLSISADKLQRKVKANAKLDTVLITVKVTDESPVRARDIANALSDEFVELVRELETPTAGAAPDARVVVEQRAAVPAEPLTPRPAQNLAFGLILGVIAGIGVALLRDSLDNTVKDQATLEQLTATGMVGSIPTDKTRASEPAVSFGSENSAIAESFRKLRTNLHFLAVDNPPRMIVVTSSVPSEGKTTTAINIALALAESENSVLLVDGDMRRPAVSSYLDVVGSVGLSTVLSGSATTSEALQETRYQRLSVLAAGTTPPNPSELLGSLAAKSLLQELREQFDYVIIDTPPLMAVTDAAVLSVTADGALMMVRFGHTKREQVAQSVRMLKDVGASLLGTVMTMTPVRGRGAYSYQYDYYSEGSGSKRSNAQRRNKVASSDAATDRSQVARGAEAD